MKLRLSACIAAVAFIGCGEPDYVPKETYVKGSVQGFSFTTPHALFSSEEGSFGRNHAVVLISDLPHSIACPQQTGGRSQVFSPDAGTSGFRLPSLLINVPAESKLEGHRHDLNDSPGFTAHFDPGCSYGAPADGGSDVMTCGTAIAATEGVIWVYETDSIKADRLPHARARFDLTFGEDRIEGGILADPCAGVTDGCSMDPSTVLALGAIATAMTFWRRRRAL